MKNKVFCFDLDIVICSAKKIINTNQPQLINP